MFGRNRSETTSDRGATSVEERPADEGEGRFSRTTTQDRMAEDDRTMVTDRDRGRGGTAAGTAGGGLTREHMRDVRARQRDEYGGINWGAAFFGWLVAVGLGAILIGLVAGAGAAVGLTQFSASDARGNAGTIGLGGAIAALIVLMIAYYAGGYVAGRMSRFDGARQGAGAWIIGIVITVILGVLAAIFGSQYNVLSQLNLPRIPLSGETLTTGGIITLVVVLAGTLIAAIAGGKVGERYHRRIDRVAVTD